MAFSFDDVMKEAHIEDIDYISKDLLAENGVVFCITAIDDVEVVNSKFGATRQWAFTIRTTLSSGDARKYFVSFPYNPARRDAVVNAIQTKLKELEGQGKEPIVHSLHILAKAQSQYDSPYYKLEGVTEKGKPVCTCSIVDDAVSTDIHEHKPRSK